MRIHLWEYAPSPHLGNVLSGLARLGHKAYYMVGSEQYQSRMAEGWTRPDLPGVEILLIKTAKNVDAFIMESDVDDVHICVGLRGNFFIRSVAVALRRHGRRFLIFMETINERKFKGILKRPLYRMHFWRIRANLEAVLATGMTTPGWVARRGVSRERIFEFAYFLSSLDRCDSKYLSSSGPFRLIYIGSLIERKNVSLLLEALPTFRGKATLDIVGNGPLRSRLEKQAAIVAPGQVTFHGTRPMVEITRHAAGADCLVLPSHHDGWGAVVSESLMVGTPVVCSEGCGASVVVEASGTGAVFAKGDLGDLVAKLRVQVAQGRRLTRGRTALANWARCLAEPAGAAYLDAIIRHIREGTARPAAPWLDAPRCVDSREGILS